MNFEVYAKHGRGWRYLGVYSAGDSRRAAIKAKSIHNYSVLKVRPEYSADKFFRYVI